MPFPSRIIFANGKAQVQIDIALAKIMNLVRIKFGHFDQLAAAGPHKKLSNSLLAKYQAQQKIVNEILKTAEDWEAAIVYQVVIILGRLDVFQQYAKHYLGINGMEHEGLIHNVLKRAPHLLPSFDRLSEQKKKLILDALSASTTNIGAVIQGEEVAASLIGMQKIDKKARDFKFLNSLISISGVNGANVSYGNILSEDKLSIFAELYKASKEFSEEAHSAYSVYQTFQQSIAKKYAIKSTNPAERLALSRLVLQTESFAPAELDLLCEVFADLPRKMQVELIKELSNTGENAVAIKLFFAPAVWRNIQNYYSAVKGLSAKEIKTKTFQYGLALSHYFFSTTQSLLKDHPILKRGVFRLDISPIGGNIAKTLKGLLDGDGEVPAEIGILPNSYFPQLNNKYSTEGIIGEVPKDLPVNLERKVKTIMIEFKQSQKFSALNRATIHKFYDGGAEILPQVASLSDVRRLNIGEIVYDQSNLPAQEQVAGWLETTFQDGIYMTIRPTRPVVVVRSWDGNPNTAGLLGEFFSAGMLDKFSTKHKLAVLPEWNNKMTEVSLYELRPGTIIRIRLAEKQTSRTGTTMPGGELQIHIPNPKELYRHNKLTEVRRIKTDEIISLVAKSDFPEFDRAMVSILLNDRLYDHPRLGKIKTRLFVGEKTLWF